VDLGNVGLKRFGENDKGDVHSSCPDSREVRCI
jgi:hypothetical protein